jgi:hypothetical protein
LNIAALAAPQVVLAMPSGKQLMNGSRMPHVAEKIHIFLYVTSLVFWYDPSSAMLENSHRAMPGAHMRYFVIGAIAVIVVVAGVSLVPDLVRYIKISSM